MRAFIFFTAMMAVALADNKELEAVLSNGNKQFTAKFFAEVVKEKPGESLVMSAFSVLQPLAHMSLASVGESHDQLLAAIGVPNDNVTKALFPFVNTELQAVKGVELKMANKIYIPKDRELNVDFGALSKSVFDSEVKNIDFLKAKEAASEINEWVEDHTNRRIKNLVSPDSLGPDTRAVLVNALYFKGSWAEKFDKADTTERDFHVTKDKTIKLPTMHKQAHYKYTESADLDAKLLELPYQGGEASMLIVLPNQVDGISSLLEKLQNPNALDTGVKRMYKREVNVFLPTFKIESTINLKDVLQQIGVTNLFDPSKARLDNLLKGESDLYVSDAIQKAFIEVNEEGAEAAAANAFVAVDRSGRVDPRLPITFEIDRPFCYFIRHHTTTLFNGVYVS